MNENRQIRVLLIQPGDDLALTLRVPAELDTLQALVGGMLEVIAWRGDASFYINEEGKALGLGPNVAGFRLHRTGMFRLMPGDFLVGPIVITGRPDEEGWDTDVPESVKLECERTGLRVIGWE